MEQEKENSIQLSTATAPTMKQPRNCAFDIARIVAMFLIVSSHFLGHGGFANNMTGANFVFGRILTSLFNPSVNLFVLIGAYFTCTSKKLKWQRLAKLYAQVWIYSMALFVVFLCIYGKESFSWNWLLSSLFPVICGKYWFFSAYIFMMLASPLLNVVIARIDKKTHFAACAVFIVLGILAGDVHVLPQLAMGDGYNVIWFIMLYFIAAFVRKYDVKVPKKWMFVPILAYSATLVAGYFCNTAQCSIVRSASAIILLVALKDVKTTSVRFSKFITGVSATMFGIYLIHDSNEMRGYMYQNIFHASKFYDSDVSFLIMLGFVAATFFVCMAIEQLRLLIDKPITMVFEKLVKNARAKKAATAKTNIDADEQSAPQPYVQIERTDNPSTAKASDNDTEHAEDCAQSHTDESENADSLQ